MIDRRKLPKGLAWQPAGWPCYGGRATLTFRMDPVTENLFVEWRYDSGGKPVGIGLLTPKRCRSVQLWRLQRAADNAVRVLDA